jgi:hypothetical protein
VEPIRDIKRHRLLRPRKCLLCPLIFEPSATWQRFCGTQCRDIGMGMRKSVALAEWICIYCGQVGDNVDHVPPTCARPNLISMGLQFQYPFLEVRCCGECNSALGSQGFWTVTERKRYIKQWLVRRYARVLGMPEWTPEELLDLGPGLSIHVSSGIYKKQVIERRLRF